MFLFSHATPVMKFTLNPSRTVILTVMFTIRMDNQKRELFIITLIVATELAMNKYISIFFTSQTAFGIHGQVIQIK